MLCREGAEQSAQNSPPWAAPRVRVRVPVPAHPAQAHPDGAVGKAAASLLLSLHISLLLDKNMEAKGQGRVALQRAE